MSAIVRTTTPFLEQKLLCEALSHLGVQFTLHNGHIITERVDHYGNQSFILVNGRYQFQHDSTAERSGYVFRKINFKQWETVGAFLKAVEESYYHVYQERQRELERLKEEQKRMTIEKEKALVIEEQLSYEHKLREIQEQKLRAENEMLQAEQQKQAYIENQKQAVYYKAKEMGYEVEEVKKANKIQLVLVKRK